MARESILIPELLGLSVLVVKDKGPLKHRFVSKYIPYLEGYHPTPTGCDSQVISITVHV